MRMRDELPVQSDKVSMGKSLPKITKIPIDTKQKVPICGRGCEEG